MDKKVLVSVDNELWDRVRLLAKAEERTVKWVVVTALKRYVAEASDLPGGVGIAVEPARSRQPFVPIPKTFSRR